MLILDSEFGHDDDSDGVIVMTLPKENCKSLNTWLIEDQKIYYPQLPMGH